MQAYKSLLTVLTGSSFAMPALEQAIALTRAQDGHLDLLAVGVDRSPTGFYYAGANAMILQETLTRAIEDAEATARFGSERLEKSDIRWSSDTAVAAIADVSRHISVPARFSDLVVLPMPYGEARGADMEAVVEAALFDGRASVLVVPDQADPITAPQRIVIGWNQSKEALAAIRGALPLLQGAQKVHIAVIGPPVHGPDRSDPGGTLSQMLARHGVRCEIDVLSRTVPRISEILNRHTLDVNADMVVMGAYGHSRIREAILGGATRHMLEIAKVPVFMAH